MKKFAVVLDQRPVGIYGTKTVRFASIDNAKAFSAQFAHRLVDVMEFDTVTKTWFSI